MVIQYIVTSTRFIRYYFHYECLEQERTAATGFPAEVSQPAASRS
jgi:hypothetical protein